MASSKYNEEQKAAFSRRAAAVMNAPYWTRNHDNVPDDKVPEWWDEVRRERELLLKALRNTHSYNDLPTPARKIFKAAESYLEPDDGGDLEDDE